MPDVTNQVVSDRIVRERTFNIVHLRKDGRDALAQIMLTLHQIMEEGKFTGQVMVNFSQGSPNNMQVKETQKV